MPKVNQKSKEHKESRAGSNRGGGSARARKYTQLRIEHPEWSKAKCKRDAGYSQGTHAAAIERTKDYKDLQRRIEDAQQVSGFNVGRCLRRLATTVGRKGARNDDAATRAIKVGTEITGERRPEQVNVSILTDDEILGKLIDA